MNQDAMHGNKASPDKHILVTHSLPYSNIYVGNGSCVTDFFQKSFPHSSSDKKSILYDVDFDNIEDITPTYCPDQFLPKIRERHRSLLLFLFRDT